MNILRGGGQKKPLRPFRYNPILAKRAARLHRLKAKGLTPAGDKASLRAMCDEAARSHTIRKVPARAATTEHSTNHRR
jgi:hypothetical protein